MFIAHLPSGYLLSHMHKGLRRFPFWVMLGSVLPDLDMIYFYVIDHGAVHHHSYLTHRPLLWAGLLVLFCVFGLNALGALAAGALLHLTLDSLTGKIAWGWPIWDQASPLIVVPATQEWWVMSFLLHWTFAAEVFLCGLSAACFFQERHKRRH